MMKINQWMWGRILFAVTSLWVASSQGSIITAPSVSFTDVSNAVANAQPGDTVQMPPGTNSWSGTLTVGNSISLIGSGTNQTVILDEVPRVNNGLPVITFVPTGIGVPELSHFTIQQGTTNTSYNYHGDIVVSSGNPWRIHDLYFNAPYAKAILVYGSSYSVIDHCSFMMQAEGIIAYGNGYGDDSWATPVNWGSSNVLYMEDNYFTNYTGHPAGAFDAYGGARAVFRHNTVINDFFANHGTETSGRYRGCRSVEVYNNNFTWNGQGSWDSFYTAINIRSGSGVIFSNTLSGFPSYQSLCAMVNDRSGQSYDPWGGASGFNPWDSNSTNIYASVVHTGPNASGSLVVTNAGWTTNQWVGYTVYDVLPQRFGLIIANSSDTIVVMTPQLQASMTFNTGDRCVIYLVNAVLDGTGMGSGDLISGDNPLNTITGTTSYPRQALDPIYFWGNMKYTSPIGAISGFPNIQLNKHFYNDVPKPGYTPFVYPHPLTKVHLAPPTQLNAH